MTRRGWLSFWVAGVLSLSIGGIARGDADADWRQIEAMDSNAPAGQWKSRAEAEAGTVEYLGKQEQELRGFVDSYPEDPHAPDAKLRLAHLLATRADLEQKPFEQRAADAILDELEREPAMKSRRGDVEFARISIFMQRVDAITGTNRDTLLEQARAFAKEFPDDRRVAPLLAEVASAFDNEPKTARSLLEQARPIAKTAELQARIGDDLKRLGMLGKPLQMQWISVQGERIDLQKMRGKAVLIYFFASWSSPAMYELDWVKQLAARANPERVQVLGICLDSDPVAVPALLADHGISWPVYCDGRDWQGELVRSLGINALPELWIVDRAGILRSLDAKQDAEALIESGVRE
jgi:thiol-disulfide isomerase/thioredoxin